MSPRLRSLVRIIVLVAALAVLGWGAAGESHAVHSFIPETETERVDGFAFTEAATTDRYMLRNGLLYDIASLSTGRSGLQDCPT